MLLTVAGAWCAAAAQRTAPANAPSIGTAVPRSAAHGVFSYHNDWGRTGLNPLETTLTPANVTPARFGLLRTDYRVDGAVLAQPLYVPNVHIGGTAYNIVVVVTAHDTVYAFDADVDRHPQHWSAPLWARSLLNAGETPVPFACEDIDVEVGITSTPVVDPRSNTLYVVAKSQTANARQQFRLHAIDLTTGLDDLAAGGAVHIAAADPVTGKPFDARQQNQRPGLALVNGIVYLAFASNCDHLPYHGWLLGYDVTRHLEPAVVFNTSPGRNFGGVWASGAAPAVGPTATSMFFSVGNGPYDPLHHQWGNAILNVPVDRGTVAAAPAIQPLDYFSPFNQAGLNANDLDLGSGGVMLLPDQSGAHPHVLIAGSKQGVLYVLDQEALTLGNQHSGGCTNADLAAIARTNAHSKRSSYSDTCDPVLQAIKNVSGHDHNPQSVRVYQGPAVYGTPAYASGSVYVGAAGDNLKQFSVQDGLLVNVPVSMSQHQFDWPGVTPSISSNGIDSAIIWVVDSGDNTLAGDPTDAPAVLYAFDANDLSRLLYKSSGTAEDERDGMVATNARDRLTHGHRFAVPTVFGGKVFVATRSRLHVFGLF